MTIQPTDTFSTEDIAKAKNFGSMLSGVGTGKKEQPECLKNFSKDHAPYFEHLQLLNHLTGMGFDSRQSDDYSRIIKHFSESYRQKSYFAVNAGNPAGGQIKALIDLPLSDTSLGYYNKNFIGKDILTPSPVIMRTGHVGRYGNEHNNPPDKNAVRAEGRANVKQLYPYSRDFLNYMVGTYAIKDSLSPDDYMNDLKPFNVEADVVIALKHILMMICEIDIAETLTTTANYPTESVINLSNASERFDVPATSSIDKEVTKLRNSIRTKSGVDANTAVMDANVFEAVSRHPQARGTIFKDMSHNRTASEEEVRKLLQVDRLLIAKTSRTNANGPEAPRSRVWGKDIWMGYVNPTKAHRQLTFGYFHHFRNNESFVITRQSTGNPMNKELFCYQSWQHHYVNFNCGGIIKNAIS